jgi:Zn-dependent M28 family amino/carboxypeptidase
VDEADAVGHEVRLRVMGERRPSRSNDVVAVRRPAAPGRGYVLLLGHIDGWYTAAADNGGGAAAVLRAAQLLAVRPPNGAGVAVALVDGEEVGYVGSTGLVAQLQSPAGVAFADGGPALHMADIESVVNLDAPSAIASDTPLPEPFSWRVLVHTNDATALRGVATFTAAGVLGLPLEASVATELNGGITRTDAGSFADAGKPVIWPVAGYPEYHTTADTLAVVDPVDLENVATGATATVRLLGRA